MMERRDFLATLGVGAAAVLTLGCFNSCSKEDEAPGNVDFTLDLDEPANAALKDVGGFLVRNDVVVARTTDGNYVAATVVCPHEGKRRVLYNGFANEWNCDAHGARFRVDGTRVNNVASKNLKVYNTTLEGNLLRIFS
jgi:nitrite reductase/ring-hydroxylating ferredoxin subunit